MADEVLEKGAVHVIYRPRVEERDPSGLVDVQDLHLVLVPEDGPARQITIGRKRLPEIDVHEANWGFVAGVSDDPADLVEGLGRERYETQTRGVRDQPGARVAATGRYALTAFDGSVRFSYVLDVPDGDAQEQLAVEDRAQYVIQVKNPESGSPPGAGLREAAQADFPPELQERFASRAWIGPRPPDFLNHEGAELVLIGARQQPAEGTEAASTDEAVLEELRRATDTDPVEPLETGEWA